MKTAVIANGAKKTVTLWGFWAKGEVDMMASVSRVGAAFDAYIHTGPNGGKEKYFLDLEGAEKWVGGMVHYDTFGPDKIEYIDPPIPVDFYRSECDNENPCGVVFQSGRVFKVTIRTAIDAFKAGPTFKRLDTALNWVLDNVIKCSIEAVMKSKEEIEIERRDAAKKKIHHLDLTAFDIQRIEQLMDFIKEQLGPSVMLRALVDYLLASGHQEMELSAVMAMFKEKECGVYWERAGMVEFEPIHEEIQNILEAIQKGIQRNQPLKAG
jgi:hypothetical protein